MVVAIQSRKRWKCRWIKREPRCNCRDNNLHCSQQSLWEGRLRVLFGLCQIKHPTWRVTGQGHFLLNSFLCRYPSFVSKSWYFVSRRPGLKYAMGSGCWPSWWDLLENRNYQSHIFLSQHVLLCSHVLRNVHLYGEAVLLGEKDRHCRCMFWILRG